MRYAAWSAARARDQLLEEPATQPAALRAAGATAIVMTSATSPPRSTPP